jgi:adenine-specific DNA-methyltransferase
MSDKRGTMSNGHDRIAGPVEKMMTADSLPLTAYGQDENEMRITKNLPKAKTPHEQESLQRQIAVTDKQIDTLVYELYSLTEDEIRIVEGRKM